MRLPVGEDLCEWLAVNTVDFYNAISVLFGTLEEFCTVQSCSLMTAGPKACSIATPCSVLYCTACCVLAGPYNSKLDLQPYFLSPHSMSTCGRTQSTGSRCGYRHRNT